MENRIYWLDNLKAIGIVLIVLGHAPAIKGDVANFIYSFHIPLFFFASGCLSQKKEFYETVTYVWKKLMIPYLFFLMISYGYWLFANIFSPVNVDFVDILNAFIVGSNYSNEFFFNAPLWFFPALISTHFIAVILNKLTLLQGMWVSIFVSMLAMFLFANLESRLPWGFDIALVMIFFFCLGRVINNCMPIQFYLLINGRVKIYSIIFIGFLLLCVLSTVNGRIDVNTLVFNNKTLFLLNSLLGILLMILISISLGYSLILEYLSKHTLWFFPLHGFAFALLTFILTRVAGMDIGMKDEYMAFSAIYTLFAFLTLSILVNLKNKVGFKWF